MCTRRPVLHVTMGVVMTCIRYLSMIAACSLTACQSAGTVTSEQTAPQTPLATATEVVEEAPNADAAQAVTDRFPLLQHCKEMPIDATWEVYDGEWATGWVRVQQQLLSTLAIKPSDDGTTNIFYTWGDLPGAFKAGCQLIVDAPGSGTLTRDEAGNIEIDGERTYISFRPIGGERYAGTYRLKNNRRSPTSGTFVRYPAASSTLPN